MSKGRKDTQKQDGTEELHEVGDIRQEQEALTEEQTACDSSSEKEEENGAVQELGEKLALLNDKYLRLSAEFDNYRKRTLKEKMELVKSAGEKVLSGILPVMDNFERALKSMEMAEDVPALREGVELIYSNFKDFLLQNGVKEMECLHADFDPELQEAVTKIPAPAEDLKGKVVDCIQKGYTLNDKVIRFPKVVVGE
ncbi:MAG: nucleotide exchange factor GrpE [Odoribacter sp.]|nr:nucleotide exchange factor GrpE [Odoribacter sp.]